MRAPPLRVLIVEDSEDDTILITEELRDRYSPSVRRVENRADMARALEDPAWDVIISDHNLPAFSAIEALDLVVDSGLDIPFIIVSGTIGEEMAVEAMKAGAHDFVMKRSLAKLLPAVEHAVESGKTRRQHRQAQVDLQESRERLRQLTAHLERVREEERASLAREIHDEMGGILTALKMDISWLIRRCSGCAEKVEEKLGSMTALTDGAIQNMRRIITALRPSILDDLGLVAALEWQLSEFGKRTGLGTALEIAPEAADLEWSSTEATVIFRIFQESLTNVVRHAEAASVSVVFVLEDGERALLRVCDDGRGIGSEALSKQGSFGILGMRERAHSVNGELTLGRGEKGGTEVVLRLPATRIDRQGGYGNDEDSDR